MSDSLLSQMMRFETLLFVNQACAPRGTSQSIGKVNIDTVEPV